VHCAAFSPDGLRIVTASEDRTTIIWDAEKHEPLMLLKHADPVERAEFSADGRAILTISGDTKAPVRTAHVWDVKTGRELYKLTCTSAEFAPNGRTILAGTHRGSPRLYQAATGRVACTLQHGVVNSARFSPDGNWIATGSQDMTTRIWHAATGRLVGSLAGHKGPVVAVGFSADARRIVTASEDSTARIWGEPESR